MAGRGKRMIERFPTEVALVRPTTGRKGVAASGLPACSPAMKDRDDPIERSTIE